MKGLVYNNITIVKKPLFSSVKNTHIMILRNILFLVQVHLNTKKIEIILVLHLYILLTSCNLIGQSIALSGGIGSSQFFLIDDNKYYKYDNNTSFYLKIDFDNIIDQWILSDMFFKIEKLSTDILVSNYGCCIDICDCFFPSTFDHVYEPRQRFDKYIIGLGAYPLKLDICKNIKFRSGLEIAYNFKSRFSFIDENIFDSRILENKQIIINAIFELQVGEIKLTDNITMIPSFNSFVGLTPELTESIHSIRYNFGLILKKALNKKHN